MKSFPSSICLSFSILTVISHIQAFSFHPTQLSLTHVPPCFGSNRSKGTYYCSWRLGDDRNVRPFSLHAVAIEHNDQDTFLAFRDDDTDSSNYIPSSGLTPKQEEDLDDLLTEALDRMFFVMDTNALQKCSSDALRNLFQQCVESVEVGESTIPGAGRGLFAKKDIPAGTIVGFYPIHAIGCKFPSGVCQSVQMSEDPNEMIDNENSAYSLFFLVNRPLCGVDVAEEYNDARLFVDMNPKNTIHEGWYCGYMNDAAIVQYPGDETYYPKSRGAQNVEIVPFSIAPFQVGVTTRNVKAGDELFVSYGYSYWINNKSLFPDGHDDEKTTKLFRPDTVLQQEEEAAVDLANTIRTVEENYQEASVALHMAFDSLGGPIAEPDTSVEAIVSNKASRPSHTGKLSPGILFRWLIQVALNGQRKWQQRLFPDDFAF